ncbi:hypothetical protein O1611_g1156 [Lasiodiplodia mahajangana]|uniref:Uncharacterized protein n=1 Tax=Lasiodiplodia mahajangana TaxID=1108764 RepID=A0ACC2JYX2_9PEZI|nr:hypothetical protein O1611_g1156 [Lasiodiplodia mahajangana]
MSNPAARAASENAPQWVFNPGIDNLDEAEKFVKLIFKHKPDNVDLVAAELAPLFGFGPNSNQDPLSRMRAQSIFTSPEITSALKEFLDNFIYERWGLAVAKWRPTLDLVHLHRDDRDWKLPGIAPFPNEEAPEKHYARFIILMLNQLEKPYPRSMMLLWLRDAMNDGREDQVSWILFHVLMYLQLKAMDLNKVRASPKEWVQHYLHKFKTENSFFDRIFKKILPWETYDELTRGARAFNNNG